MAQKNISIGHEEAKIYGDITVNNDREPIVVYGEVTASEEAKIYGDITVNNDREPIVVYGEVTASEEAKIYGDITVNNELIYSREYVIIN